MTSLNIRAQEITVFPGVFSEKYYQDTNPISRSQINTLMLNDKESAQHWKKFKSHRIIALLAIGAEIGFLAWHFATVDNDESSVVPLVGAIVSGGAAVGFALSSVKSQREAILRYNDAADIGSINLGPTHNGIGLVMNF